MQLISVAAESGKEQDDSNGNASPDNKPEREEVNKFETDTDLVEVPDVLEDRHIQLETGIYYAPYKDGSPTEEALFATLRIATGHNTEVKISCNFLEYKTPDFGMDDIYLGMKWKFKQENPTMALSGNLRLPTGTKDYTSFYPELSLILSSKYNFNEKWDIALNLGWANKYNQSSDERYNRINISGGFGYTIDSENYIYFSGGRKRPDIGNSTNENFLGVGYVKTISPNKELTVEILKGVTTSENWKVTIGMNHIL